MSDQQLVTLSQEGNLQAFNSLTARWESSLYRFVLRMIGNPEDARDVCQDALLKAYVNIKRLRDGEKFKSWLHHIALNLCRDRFRSPRARAEVRAFEEEGPEEARMAVEATRIGPSRTHGDQITLSRAIERALDEIPLEQRSAIILREFHGFTSEEIGEITGVPAATVRTRIFYGLRSMRRALGESGIEAPHV